MKIEVRDITTTTPAPAVDQPGTSLAPAPGPVATGPRYTVAPRVDEFTKLEDELDIYLDMLCNLGDRDPRTAMRDLSTISSRLTFMRVQMQRLDSQPRAKGLRTGQIQPMLEEVDRQFKLASRQLTFEQFEWDLAKGQS